MGKGFDEEPEPHGWVPVCGPGLDLIECRNPSHWERGAVAKMEVLSREEKCVEKGSKISAPCVGRCEEDVHYQRELAPAAELPAGEEGRKGRRGRRSR